MLGVSAALVLVVMVVVALVLESRATPETSVQVVPTTSTTAAPVMLPPITRSLKDGDEGDDVRMLQSRLAELKFA
ncbi:MAG: hypothetical protein EBW98_00930, partial [Actinobacteria bacterium]|nr:hypothetical protein [Actinomycetota bacterium]